MQPTYQGHTLISEKHLFMVALMKFREILSLRWYSDYKIFDILAVNI